MSQPVQFLYLYDGSFAGFLTCVFESYARAEEPACFSLFDDPRTALWPERAVETDREKAERVYRSLSRRISPEVQRWVRHGFLTCAPEKERRLYDFIRLAYRAGPASFRALSASLTRGVSSAGRSAPKTGSSPCCAPTSAPGSPGSVFCSMTAPTGKPFSTSPGNGPSSPWRTSSWPTRVRRSWPIDSCGGGFTTPLPSGSGKTPGAA